MIDKYGREISVVQSGDNSVYSAGGITISFSSATPEAAIIAAFDGMAPDGWTPPPVVPQIISDRQFFQQAAVAGLITQDEAIAAVATGTIPASLQAIVDGITDPDQKFAATMLLSGATIFERNHPLTEVVGAAFGWTAEQIDQFFIAAGQL